MDILSGISVMYSMAFQLFLGAELKDAVWLQRQSENARAAKAAMRA
ncbi:MAG: hypothetical protein GX781_05780 [Clostridiales bacterium]|nr:hypothetical protein [Clostridiales bacterium]